MYNAEGERSEPNAQGGQPGVLASTLHRGLRPAHVYKGCSGTWETSWPPGDRNGGAEREAERRWGARSRSAAVGARTLGNRPKGPSRAKGGTGTENRRRD